MPHKTRQFSILILILLLGAGCKSTSQPTTTPLPLDPAPTKTIAAENIPTATPQVTAQTEIGVATSQPEPSPVPTLEPPETWVKVYGGNHENMSSDIALAPDGGFLIVGGIGKIFDENREGGVLLMKTDTAGNIVWQKVYGGEEFDIGWSITPTKDDHFLIAGETTSFGVGGRDIYLIKVDPEGNEIWSKTYGSELDETIAMVQPSLDGGYLLMGNQVDPEDIIIDPGTAGYGGFAGRSDIHVIKIDTEGNEIWSQTFENEANTIASSGSATQDGGYLILGTIIHLPSLDTDIYLLKMDDDGNEVWSRTWENDSHTGYALIGTHDDRYLITGIIETSENPVSDVILLKINEDGDEIWRTNFGDPTVYEAGKRMIESQDGNLLILCSATENLFSGTSNIFLIAADKDGKHFWDNTLSFFHYTKVSAILPHPDGGYVITGAASTRGQTHNAFLIKTDANGNVTAKVETVPFP